MAKYNKANARDTVSWAMMLLGTGYFGVLFALTFFAPSVANAFWRVATSSLFAAGILLGVPVLLISSALTMWERP